MFDEIHEKNIGNVAVDLTDNGIGKVVGEASGNMPNSYGQITRFVLPNSGLIMQVSTKDWHRIDETKEELPVLPDI